MEFLAALSWAIFQLFTRPLSVHIHHTQKLIKCEKKIIIAVVLIVVYNKYFSYENQGQPFMYFKIPRTKFKFCCLPSFIFVWIFLFWRHTQSKTMTITMVSKQNKAPPQNVFIITYIKCFIYYVKQLIQMFKKKM